MRKRTLVAIWVVCSTVVFMGGLGIAQDKYPERPIQMINPVNPGGYNDLGARMLGDFLQKYLGKPVVAVNKPGGGGFIAGSYVANAKPDGYTLLAGVISQRYPENLVYFKPANYSSKDLVNISCFGGFIAMIAVREDAPWKSLKEMVEYSRSNPGKLKWAHSGVGNAYWMMGAALLRESGVKMQDIPHNGDGESMTALLGGHVDMAILTYGGSFAQQVEAKKIRPLALYYNSRIDELPGVPTTKELGYKESMEFLRLGLSAPAGTPESIIAKLDGAVKKVSDDPEYRDKMKKLQMPLVYMGTKDFQASEAQDSGKVRSILKAMGYL